MGEGQGAAVSTMIPGSRADPEGMTTTAEAIGEGVAGMMISEEVAGAGVTGTRMRGGGSPRGTLLLGAGEVGQAATTMTMTLTCGE